MQALPNVQDLEKARGEIIRQLPDTVQALGISKERIDNLKSGLNGSSQSSRYYGFVTGGATEISCYADNIVTDMDQNVQVHLPNETIATDVEDAALVMLCQLIDVDSEIWNHRTFTTGATASNILGLAVAREHVVAEAGRRAHQEAQPGINVEGSLFSVARVGLLKAMKSAQVDDVQILTTLPHSSIRKAASVVGLGHDSVVLVGRSSGSDEHMFDFEKLELAMKKEGTLSIIVVSCSEVNTGLFATEGRHDFERLRALADAYGAWIHVDAAIGLLARVLNKAEHPDCDRIIEGVEGLELADSIAGDAHKLLNVPYDCGIFLSRHLHTATRVFQNPGAAYLTGGSGSNVPSPLNIGIENSRRFRALPVYANLIHYGLKGYQDMLIRQINLARKFATFIQGHKGYELLPQFRVVPSLPPRANDMEVVQTKQIQNTFMIVCFRARDEEINQVLANRIKEKKNMYVSGTTFRDGKPAVRIAISNWQASDDDFEQVKNRLEQVLE